MVVATKVLIKQSLVAKVILCSRESRESVWSNCLSRDFFHSSILRSNVARLHAGILSLFSTQEWANCVAKNKQNCSLSLFFRSMLSSFVKPVTFQQTCVNWERVHFFPTGTVLLQQKKTSICCALRLSDQRWRTLRLDLIVKVAKEILCCRESRERYPAWSCESRTHAS